MKRIDGSLTLLYSPVMHPLHNLVSRALNLAHLAQLTGGCEAQVSNFWRWPGLFRQYRPHHIPPAASDSSTRVYMYWSVGLILELNGSQDTGVPGYQG